MASLAPGPRAASAQTDRERGAGPYCDLCYCVRSPTIYQLNGSLIFLEILFTLIHEYWAHSHRSSILLRAILISCNSAVQPYDYAVIVEMAEQVSKGGVEMLSRGTFGRHAHVPLTWHRRAIPRTGTHPPA